MFLPWAGLAWLHPIFQALVSTFWPSHVTVCHCGSHYRPWARTGPACSQGYKYLCKMYDMLVTPVCNLGRRGRS
jgi:hypothetical protein